MGYIYGQNARDNRVLACDSCGTIGGVRKRTCPHKVLTDSIRSSNGQRHSLAYCPAPALCGPCLAKHGGTKALHAACAEGAAASQAKYDAKEARYQSGEPMLSAGYGDWADWVPEGYVGASFTVRGGEDVYALIPAEEYRNRPGTDAGLSDFPSAVVLKPSMVPAE